MALILNLETSTTTGSVALALDGHLLAASEMQGDYSHSRTLGLMVEHVLALADKKTEDLDAIAVAMGPGSYTGLRIGLSTAKGLAYGLNKPLIGLDTLQILAEGLRQQHTLKEGWLCPMLDARRMEVYCALYEVLTGREVLPSQPYIVDENFLADFAQKPKVWFMGPGAFKCKDILEPLGMSYIPAQEPSARHMVRLSHVEFGRQAFLDLAYSEPKYLK